MRSKWKSISKTIRWSLNRYFRIRARWQLIMLVAATFFYLSFGGEEISVLDGVIITILFLMAWPMVNKLWHSQHYIQRTLAFVIGWLIFSYMFVAALAESRRIEGVTVWEKLGVVLFVSITVIAIELLIVVLVRLLEGLIRWWDKQSSKTPKRVIKAVLGVMFLVMMIISAYSFKTLQETNKRLVRLEEVMTGEEMLSCAREALAAKVGQSIVRVVGGYSEGSGVIVRDDGTIITNFHVIQGEPAPKVVLPDYTFRTANILMADKDKDIAILKIDLKTPYYLPVINNDNELKPLKKVYSVGYPLGTEIAGDPTIQEGRFVALRQYEGSTLIHTDLSLQEGQSGGALTNGCGQLLGINQSSLSGASFTISNGTILETWFSLLGAKEPLKDVSKIEFKPQESPVETVKAFYNYQKTRQLHEAYGLLDPKKAAEVPYEDWVGGYMEVIDVEVLSATASEDDPQLVTVKLTSKDLVGQEVVDKYFEGTWRVEKIDGVNYLTEHNLKEVNDPGWGWFYDPLSQRYGGAIGLT